MELLNTPQQTTQQNFTSFQNFLVFSLLIDYLLLSTVTLSPFDFKASSSPFEPSSDSLTNAKASV